MSGYIGTQPVPQATQTRETFTATAGQTSFATAGYTPNYLDVWLNGVKLVNGTDFTATNGSDVVLTSGAADGDTLEVLAYSTFQTGDFVPTSGGTFSGNVTVDGDLTVDTNTLFVDAANNRVGFGTSAPTEKLHVVGTIIGQSNDNYFGNYSSGAYVDIGNLATSEMWLDTRSASLTDVPLNLRTKGSGAIKFTIGSTECARIDASANMRLSTNTSYLEIAPNATWGAGFRFGGNGTQSDATYANICTTNGNIHIDPRVGAFGTYLNWYSGTNGVHVGNATSGGYGQIRASAFTTISDYRLKENVVPLAGAADRLAQIPVHRFNFIADPVTIVDGFLAHEVQNIVPEAIHGTKDEVDNEGNPKYQGIDQSKLVPLLTAALQEALGRIETLEAEVAALKGAANV